MLSCGGSIASLDLQLAAIVKLSPNDFRKEDLYDELASNMQDSYPREFVEARVIRLVVNKALTADEDGFLC